MPLLVVADKSNAADAHLPMLDPRRLPLVRWANERMQSDEPVGTHVRSLDFEAEDFPQTARKLIIAGVPFTFRVTGRGLAVLAPMVLDGRIEDLGRLSAQP